MKKILTILCCTFILFTQSKAQSDTISGDYIVLYSGKIIQSDVITYKNSYFHAGDKKYNEDDVSLYRNAEGSFANWKHLVKKGDINFLKAETLGKISVYRYSYVSSFEDKLGRQQTITTLYYNKGMEPLKKYKYKNLKKDLRDNPNCTKLLRQERVFKTVKVVCLSLALVSTGYGMITLNNFSYKPWLATVALATIGTKMGKIGNKKIEKALEFITNSSL